MGNGVNWQGVFLEKSRNELENGCFGRMYEGCATPLLGGEDDGKERGKGGEEYAGGYGEHKRRTSSIGSLRSLQSGCAK